MTTTAVPKPPRATLAPKIPRKTAAPPRPYHHGSLPETLLAAAEAVLVRDGIAGLGLRAIAREADVSHTAPKHHFGDTTGLLSELAALGFLRLRDAMVSAMGDTADAPSRRNAIGHAYVHFAYENAALFGLMFRNEIIDMRRPSLREAAAAAMRVMAPTIGGAALPMGPPKGPVPVTLSRADAMRVTAAWAYVHGLATLLIDHRLRGVLRSTTAFDDPIALVDAVLQDVHLGLDFST
ncbi:MAG: transcription regulator protein [Variovorax sp.]|nr:transcription regulator protein [Variovorax sp.]